MVRRFLSLVAGLCVTIIAFFAHNMTLWLYWSIFPQRYFFEPGLVIATGLVCTGIYLLRRSPGLPAVFLLVGSVCLLAYYALDGVLSWQIADPDPEGLLSRLYVPLRTLGSLTYFGIFGFAAQLTHRHLTKRWSEPPAVMHSRSK